MNIGQEGSECDPPDPTAAPNNIPASSILMVLGCAAPGTHSLP